MGFYINLEIKRDKMKKIFLPLNKPQNKVTDFQQFTGHDLKHKFQVF